MQPEGETKGGKDPTAALVYLVEKEQPGSSGTQRKNKKEQVQKAAREILFILSDQTPHPAPKEAEKCPVRCSERSRTGPEPAGTT